ncbi:MAG: MobC family plasmid mobilization relaxosome protein [Lachnospiraceae bacterium]|nr:MobC family plasmid mobilization relaxosome protein [Lachnospiraceae bacterium]
MDNEKFRMRSRDIHIMATEYEYARIKEQQEASGKCSLREYMIDMAMNGYVINVDYSNLKELAYEINKIGVNINQIAHKINIKDAVYQTDMDEVKEKIDLIWKLIRTKFYQMS